MKKKTQKIIICISLFIILFANFGNIFGATNPEYKPTVSVSETALDSKIKSSVLLDTLANMINALASLAESLLGGVFQTLTNDKIFPWADRIIFNGIAFLDINFLNPDSNSLFGNSSDPTILGEVVRNVYSTVFSLAVLFLGVAVGIMAIRLAISTIAAEKAKYKQAIVNWATCIVMLFLMHYILAFVFWVNEQMVRIASGVLIDAISESGINEVDFSEALNAIVEPEQRVQNFFTSAKAMPSATLTFSGALHFLNTLSSNANVDSVSDRILSDADKTEVANRLLTQTTTYVNNRLVYVEDNAGKDAWKRFMQDLGSTNRMMADIAVPRLEYDVNDAIDVLNMSADDKEQANKDGYYTVTNGKLFITEAAYMSDAAQYESDIAAFAKCMANKENASVLYEYYKQHPEYKLNTGDNPNFWQSTFNSAWSVLSAVSTLGLSSYMSGNQNSIEEDAIIEALRSSEEAKKNFAKARVEIDACIISAATGVKSSTTDIIANLGQFFKQSAYVYTTEEVQTSSGSKKEVVTGWRASKVSVTGALLYAIFLFQSCMYFITYVKRLFFVIMLSMFGPIVVIYDFFMKSASG